MKINTRSFIAACAIFTAIICAPPAHSAPNYIGINISQPSDYCADQTFADVMLSCRDWKTLDNSRAARVDGNGWPIEDAKVFVWAGANNMNGTYTIYCPVNVGFSCWGDGTVSNVHYDPATGFTTAIATVTSTGNTTFELWISKVPSTGLKYVKMVRPGHDTTEVFSKQFLAAVSKFSGIRFMDFTGTNGNAQVNWSDRVLPSQNQCQSGVGYGWQGKGAAWEYAIALCNKAGKDGWICIPAKANDDYIRNLAALWRDGGNGFAGLRPDLKLYVEYSNELWNSTPAFQQFKFNHDAAVTEVAAGNSPLSFDGNTDEWTVTGRRIGKRGTEVSTIFRSVFGDGQMMSRIRPVLEWQQGGGWGPDALSFVEQYYGAVRSGNAVPHPVNYFFWGGGGSAYYNPDNTSDALTIDNIWTSETFSTAAWLAPQKADADWAATYGLKRAAYEGGPSLDNEGHSESIKAKAVMDPRMRDCVIQHHDTWSNSSGDMLFYLTMVGDYPWGFTDKVTNFNTPKMQAVDSLGRAPCAPVTIGRSIPATIPGGAYDLPDNGPGNGSTYVSQNDMKAYTIRCDRASVVTFTPHFANNGGIAVRIDGILRSTQPGMITDTLSPGLHSYRINATSGSYTLNSIDVQVVSVVGTAGKPALAAMLRLSAAFHRGLIKVSGLSDAPVSIGIQDLASRTIGRYDGVSRVGEILIPVRDFAPGTYVVRVVQESRATAVKVVTGR